MGGMGFEKYFLIKKQYYLRKHRKDGVYLLFKKLQNINIIKAKKKNEKILITSNLNFHR